MEPYSFTVIEKKWQQRWESERTFKAPDRPDKPKFYALEYFPYPSGAGLSVGHGKNYIPADAFCRFKSMNGFSVLHPMGWDAFGQPAENEAIKRGRNPREMIREYAAGYKHTLQRIGCSYDWSREINSSDPEYYKWTQWFFLLLYRRGLAYRASAPISWCPSCKTGLANEEVKEGRCWRCDSRIEQRSMPQWYFRITAYADRLLSDLDRVDWPQGVKKIQRQWIGRNEDGNGTYKLRDWLISRQRYWGAPIPIVHCARCGEVPVPDEQLPVKLPIVESYGVSGTGESPLAAMPEFVNTLCPKCQAPARRETDTMAGFACSSWYFLRFADPHNSSEFAARDAIDRWCPVDLYAGGTEHAVMHLLYARFWTKVMYDAGLIGFDEPFKCLRNQGSVLAYTPGRAPRHDEQRTDEDGDRVVDWIVLKPEERAAFPKDQTIWRWVRMSKSKGNVVTPDEIVDKYGADTLRIYEMVVAPFEDTVQWNEDGINGASRFINRVWRWANGVLPSYDSEWRQKLTTHSCSADEQRLRQKLHQTIDKVTRDIESFSFNTAISALMELINELNSWGVISNTVASEVVETLIRLLAPFAPHIAEELWERIGGSGSTYQASWPKADPAVAAEKKMSIAIQVDGRVRYNVTVSTQISDTELQTLAAQSDAVKELLSQRPVARVIIVPRKLINFVRAK